MKIQLVLIVLLTFVITTPNRAQSIIIENINIIDVESGKIKKNQYIAIENQKISIISTKKITPLENTKVINGINKFIIPGMIDSHIHFFQTGNIYTRPDAIDLTSIVPYKKEIQFAKDILTDNFRRYLRLGITTIMDLGGPFYNFKIRDSIAKHNLSPNVYVTGPLFSSYQPKAFSKLKDTPIENIKSISEATALFNKMLVSKPDFIKIWYIASKNNPAENYYPIVEHVAELTHKNNLKLAIHATQLKTAKLAIKAGADILVHSVSDTLIDPEFINLLKKSEVTYIPTLIVSKNYGKGFLTKLDNHYQDLTFANPMVYRSFTDLKQFSNKEIPERIATLRENQDAYINRINASESIMLKNLKTITTSGVNIATGTDAGNIGTVHASSYIQEIEAMQRSGISNLDILKASTINAARGFGLSEKLGTIQKGKIADLVILKNNPLENIKNINSVDMVIKNGEVLEIDELIKETPEQLIQRQVNAYNARDLDAFINTYSDDIKIYNFPEQLIMDGKEQVKERFAKMFQNTPNLYCEIKNRMVLGNKVIDQEHVRFGNKYSDVMAIYEIKNGVISKVTFVR